MSTPTSPQQAGTAGNQGSKAGTAGKGARGKPRQVQKFPADEFKLIRPSSVSERAAYKRKREERSEQQKLVDSLVWSVYEDWKEAGMPRKFVDIPLAVWPVSPHLEEDARHMLQKAAVLFQRTLYYGDCPTVGTGAEKRIHLAFYVVDRKTEVEGAPADGK
jgi:hypothetical protein